jgi:hypothetical protein
MRQVSDFGELYRAAFAETDPNRKVALLCEVRRVIDQWERVLEAGPSAAENVPRRPQQPERSARGLAKAV